MPESQAADIDGSIMTGTAEKSTLVSVVIPTCNRGWSLKESIDSVLNQDFDGFELIVVDDGSVDDTRKILEAYKGRLITVHQGNAGVSAARNRGAALSRGRYLAFLDSDDVWLPRKLSVQVDFMAQNPEILVCQTEEIWIRNGVRINPKKKHKKPSGMIFEPSLSLCLVSPSAVMIRKDFFEQMGGFDESLPACEDYDLWLRISSRHPIHLIDTPLIVKRGGHPDQLSQEPGLDRYRIQSLLKIIASGLLTNSQKRAAIDKLKEKCAIYATGCRKRGRTEEAERYIRMIDSL